MSDTAAQGFIARVEHDEQFAAELEALKHDPQAVLARVRAEGFDVSPAEIRDAYLERYGADLSPEQLEAVAAGADRSTDLQTIGAALGISVVAAAMVAGAF